MQSLSFLGFAAFCLVVSDAADPSIPGQWKDKKYRQQIEIPNRADVYMKTDLTIGNLRNLRINYQTNNSMNAGAFRLQFTDPPKYGFIKCTGVDGDDLILDLPVDLPAKDDDGFRIFKVETHGTMGLKISCNDELLITFEPSNEVCTGVSSWRDAWEINKEWMNFNLDNGVRQYAFSTTKSEGNTASLRSRSAYQYLAAIFVCYMMLF
ncbi:uncharacterized protein LOC134815702 [Bolinopsis microptera]|uniref:uncharacterized protein LOC134815702 n=1 Tax=Bolinopsis microptera TaxID=2820187 RepID=UPI00307A6D92